MNFRALVGGKIITYPQSATFVVLRRRGHRAYSLLASKPTFEQALTKFNRSKRDGHNTKLCVAVNGRFKAIHTS